MEKEHNENLRQKTYYTLVDLQTELNALRKKVEESSTKEEILNYLEDRVAKIET